MTEKSNEESSNDYWARVEAAIKSDDDFPPAPGRVTQPADRSGHLPAIATAPAAITVPLPDTESPRGILMQWKKNQLDRTTALQAIQAQYNAQLDALRYHLGKAVSVSNARADRIAEEFLKKLDSEHIQILKELGLRNAETRATALIEVREMIFIKLKELETKKWPQPLVDRTIRDLFDLEKRVCAEMMKELGA